jgi:hypothetical protein
VFAGRLKVTSTAITLEGFYAPPGGEFGAVLDRAFLNIAARGTARWFLERAAAALSAVAPEVPETRAAGSPAASLPGSVAGSTTSSTAGTAAPMSGPGSSPTLRGQATP